MLNKSLKHYDAQCQVTNKGKIEISFSLRAHLDEIALRFLKRSFV